jgi:hypothetical protein
VRVFDHPQLFERFRRSEYPETKQKPCNPATLLVSEAVERGISERRGCHMATNNRGR